MPILARPDADSVLAAGLVGVALHRAGVAWQVRCVPRLDEATLCAAAGVAPGDPLVLAGWGAVEADAVREASVEAVVLDARHPRGPASPSSPDSIPCASAHAWALARELDAGAPAILALAGSVAAPPGPSLDAWRAELAARAVAQGGRVLGLPATHPGPLVVALTEGIEPYFPVLGQHRRLAQEFLGRLGLPDTVPATDLGDAEARRLATALTLHLLAQGAPPLAAHYLLLPDVAGAVPGGSARRLARLCEAACAAGQGGLALGLALGDAREEGRVAQLAEAREQRILQALRKLDAGPEGPAPGGPSLPAGPLDAEPDIAGDLAWAAALSLGGGAAVGVRSAGGLLHVAAPQVAPEKLGLAADEVARAVAGDEGSGWALGRRAVVEVPEGHAPQAWAKLRRRLASPR